MVLVAVVESGSPISSGEYRCGCMDVPLFVDGVGATTGSVSLSRWSVSGGGEVVDGVTGD